MSDDTQRLYRRRDRAVGTRPACKRDPVFSRDGLRGEDSPAIRTGDRRVRTRNGVFLPNRHRRRDGAVRHRPQPSGRPGAGPYRHALATYCRKTIAAPDGTLAVSDAEAEGWATDPAYERFDLGSYLGTTVTVGDDLYGTLCYANTAPRSEPIADAEKALVEMEGHWLGYLLGQHSDAGPDDAPELTFATWDPSVDRLDSAMNALSKSERRLVLSALLETPTTDVGPLAQQVPGEHPLWILYHAHLPKLADESYIEWDPDSESVARGPNFDDVEPLLRLLVQQLDDFPM